MIGGDRTKGIVETAGVYGLSPLVFPARSGDRGGPERYQALWVLQGCGLIACYCSSRGPTLLFCETKGGQVVACPRVLRKGVCLEGPDALVVLAPNPPMRCGLGVGTKGEGHGSTTTVRVRFQQMGPVAVGSCRSGRQWRTTRRWRWARSAGQHAVGDHPGPGWHEFAGTFGWPVGGSVADGAVRPGMESLAAGPGRG